MCIICVEFQRTNDLADALRMLDGARREPRAIDPAHLDDVEKKLAEAEVASGKKTP